MEEDEDVIETGAELVGEYFEDGLVGGHRNDVLFDHHETFPCKPYDVMVQLE